MASSSNSSLPENSNNEKTTIWVPKEAFASVQRLWKPEFNWIPVPVDRSLPPAQIAYIETNPAGGPISPLPPVPRMLPKTPRTPLTPLLPPLETSLSTRSAGGYFGGAAAGGGFGDDDADGPRYFGENTERRAGGGDDDDAIQSPQELDTAITQTRLSALLSSPGANSEERPDTPSTATEPESPSTPKDILPPPPPVGGTSLPPPSPFQQNGNGSRGGGLNSNTLPQPTIRRQFADQPQLAQFQFPEEEDGASTINQQKNPPFNALHGLPVSTQWRMVDRRSAYGPKDASLAPASWKTLDGPRDLRMTDHWQTRRRDEARWQERSEKGFAVRLDMNLNVEVELKGTVNGDITLSAEALYAL